MRRRHRDPLIDTSVLVRYLTGTPSDFAARAREIIDRGEVLQITEGVLAETAHVLTSFYRVARDTVVDHLVAFLQKENILPYGIDKDTLILSLLRCRPSGRVSFPDAMLWSVARSGGVTVIYTFDQRFPADQIELRDR
jgi:predicted nucleic acid-binding protein